MSIQKMRLKRGWSQQQLADASGLSARTIQRIEAGHSGSVETLKSIAAVFEVDFSIFTAETAMNEESISTQTFEERIAFKRAERVRDFYLHLVMYLVINSGCIIINLIFSPGYLWFFGTLLFWGLGLIMHGIRVFVFDKYFNAHWERAKVEKYLCRSL